jgi:hypothetical protein
MPVEKTMAEYWSNTDQILVECWSNIESRTMRSNTDRILVKYSKNGQISANTGQILVEYLTNTVQTLIKYRAHIYQILVKYRSNTGQTRATPGSGTCTGFDGAAGQIQG